MLAALRAPGAHENPNPGPSSDHTPHTGRAWGRPDFDAVTTHRFRDRARRSDAHDHGNGRQASVSTPYSVMAGRSAIGSLTVATLRRRLRLLERPIEQRGGAGVAGLLGGRAEHGDDDPPTVAQRRRRDAPPGVGGVAGLDAVGARVLLQEVVRRRNGLAVE